MMMMMMLILMLPLQVLLSDGTVWAWGSNYYGQLGLGIESQVKAYLNWAAYCTQYPPLVCRVLLVKKVRSHSDQAIRETQCTMVSLLLLSLFSFTTSYSSSRCCFLCRCYFYFC